MILRIACFAGPVVAVAGLFACAAPEVESPGGGTDEVNTAKRDKKASSDAGTASTGKTGSSAPASAPDGGKSTTTGGTSAPATPGDATCVATCNSRLKAKCEGEDDFCDVICSETSNAFVDCLAARQSCTKAEWIACQTQFPSPNQGQKK
jgi:hypothetical protein